MRRTEGDPVRLFNGADGEWLARIATIARDRAEFAVGRQVRPQAAESDLWLAFAPLRRDPTELVVQKATELGAAALLPVLTARTQVGRVNDTRWRMIATEAAEQCERLTIPAICPARPLATVLRDWPAARPMYAAIERRELPPLVGAAGPAGLLVGPEGGFATAELDELQAHPFVVPVSLGPRILRAETASIVGLALLQAAR